MSYQPYDQEGNYTPFDPEEPNRRRFAVVPEIYEQMEQQAQDFYQRPANGIHHSMGPISKRPLANDGSGKVLVSLKFPEEIPEPFWATIEQLKDQGVVDELTLAEYQSLNETPDLVEA